MSKNTLIINAHIVNAHAIIPNGAIHIVDGTIERVFPAMETVSVEQFSDCEILDASGQLVIPGGIDGHVHFDMPFCGTFSCDDFYDGTRAAVAGGTTCIVDFATPHVTNLRIPAAIEEWQRKGEKAICDYGIHMIVPYWDDETEAELIAMKEHGITTAKFFFAYKGALMISSEDALSLITVCKREQILPQLHAEMGELVEFGRDRLIADGITGPEGHPLSRPPCCEREAAHRAITICEALDCPLYIVHNTCEEACQVISDAQHRGSRIVGESCAIHLHCDYSRNFDEDWMVAANHILSPPLRAPHQPAALWRYIQAKTISVISTDHCAFNNEQRLMGKDDFRAIPNGCIGVEERLTVAFTLGVKTNRISLQEWVACCSATPAYYFGLTKKGRIEAGMDADIVFWDPNVTRQLSAKSHFSTVETSPWEGFNATGAATLVMSRGDVVFRDGSHTDAAVPGHGRYIPRSVSPLFSSEEPLADPVYRRVERS